MSTRNNKSRASVPKLRIPTVRTVKRSNVKEPIVDEAMSEAIDEYAAVSTADRPLLAKSKLTTRIILTPTQMTTLRRAVKTGNPETIQVRNENLSAKGQVIHVSDKDFNKIQKAVQESKGVKITFNPREQSAAVLNWISTSLPSGRKVSLAAGLAGTGLALPYGSVVRGRGIISSAIGRAAKSVGRAATSVGRATTRAATSVGRATTRQSTSAAHRVMQQLKKR